MEENGNQGRRGYADGRSLWELALFSVLVLFGIASTVKEGVHPSEHKSVRESLRELGEAVESEYGILSAAEDSSALQSAPIINDWTDEQ